MSIRSFTSVTGPAAPLLRANIDTDVIIRIEHLTQTPRAELGHHVLSTLRYLADGREDPDFVLNKPMFRGAPILLAGENFGCGSSREHAVWALQGAGVRCVIAPSFGDIFHANCFQNGVLPIQLSHAIVDEIAAQCVTGRHLVVDLEACVVTAPEGQAWQFSVDERRRQMLLAGLDDIGLTLRDDALIVEWQARDRLLRPWVWNLPPGVCEDASCRAS